MAQLCQWSKIVWRREVLSIRFRMKALVYKESGSNPNLLIAEIFFSALVYPYLND